MTYTIKYKNEHSFLCIKEDKLYVISNKYEDFSSRAITVMPGFQLELGRNIDEIEDALKYTRVPVIIKEVVRNNNTTHYQIVRMHTGKVDDKVIASIVCINNIISIVGFNRALIRDGQYRKYNQLSVLHQLAFPYELSKSNVTCRSEQVKKIFSSILGDRTTLNVTEKQNNLCAIITEDTFKMAYKFVLNTKNNIYELISISLVK